MKYNRSSRHAVSKYSVVLKWYLVLENYNRYPLITNNYYLDQNNNPKHKSQSTHYFHIVLYIYIADNVRLTIIKCWPYLLLNTDRVQLTIMKCWPHLQLKVQPTVLCSTKIYIHQSIYMHLATCDVSYATWIPH